MDKKNIFLIGICEDVKEEAAWLADEIRKWGNTRGLQLEISIYHDAKQFYFHYEEENLDALFLDIRMPGENGMEMAKKLRSRNDMLPIVFVTGEKEYISEGYEVEALHYLVKPVQREKLFFCLDRIRQRKEENMEEPFLLLKTPDAVVRILQKDIYKIEVFAHRLSYTTKQGVFEVASSLRDAEKELEEGSFVSCHRGIIVGLRHVEAITKDSLLLNTGGKECEKIPVSRRLYQGVNEAFIGYYKV